MDFQQLNDQINDAINRWLDIAKEYFLNLDQNEQYGWGVMGLGLILFITGIVLI